MGARSVGSPAGRPHGAGPGEREAAPRPARPPASLRPQSFHTPGSPPRLCPGGCGLRGAAGASPRGSRCGPPAVPFLWRGDPARPPEGPQQGGGDHPAVGRRALGPPLLTRVPRPSERRRRPAAARAARVPWAGAGPARAVGPRGDARSGPCREQEGGGRRGTASGAAGGRPPRVGAGESRFSPRDTSGRRSGRGTPTHLGRRRLLRATARPRDDKRRGAYL